MDTDTVHDVAVTARLGRNKHALRTANPALDRASEAAGCRWVRTSLVFSPPPLLICLTFGMADRLQS